MGGIMLVLWFIRFFVFKLYESPKYLMGKGRDADAVGVIHRVAEHNGTASSLTVDNLTSLGTYGAHENEIKANEYSSGVAIRRTLSVFDTNHVKPLFATRRLAYSTTLLIVLWGEQYTELLNFKLSYYADAA